MNATADHTRCFRVAAHDETLREEGFLMLDLLDAAGVADCRRIYDRWAFQHTAAFSTTVQCPDLEYRRAVHAALHDRLAPWVMRNLAGYRITCAGFAVKQPGTGGAFSLHRDISMIPEGGRPALSLWCPLVDVELANGCLQVVPASHRGERGWRGPGTPPPRPPGDRAPEPRPLLMRAGEAVLFDQCTCHGSSTNAGTEARPVVTAVLLPREAPLIYCHRSGDPSGARLEVFVVSEDFYLRHAIGSRPVDGTLLLTVSEPR